MLSTFVWLVYNVAHAAWKTAKKTRWGLLYPPPSQMRAKFGMRMDPWCTLPCHISPWSVNTVAPKEQKMQIWPNIKGFLYPPTWPIWAIFCMLETNSICLCTKFYLNRFILSPKRGKVSILPCFQVFILQWHCPASWRQSWTREQTLPYSVISKSFPYSKTTSVHQLQRYDEPHRAPHFLNGSHVPDCLYLRYERRYKMWKMG